MPKRLRAVLVSSGTTIGHRNSDADWAAVLDEAGVDVVAVRPWLPRVPRLPLPLIDVLQGLLLAVAVARARRSIRPDWYFLATPQAGFFLGRRVLRRCAVRFDALTCENRRGWLGRLPRALERRALSHVPILMPMSPVRDETLPRETFLRTARHVFIACQPLPEPSSGPANDVDGVRVLCYAGNPAKKGLDIIVRSWAAAELPAGAVLLVAGIAPAAARRFLGHAGVDVPESVRFVGVLPRQEFADQLRAASAYLAATRYEDYGMPQLEALNLGTAVITVPSNGPFVAGEILQRTAPRFVSASASPDDLARTLGTVLAMDECERRDEVERVREQLATFRWDALVARVKDDLLPNCVPLKHRGVPPNHRGVPPTHGVPPAGA